jgi:hypothetical protein
MPDLRDDIVAVFCPNCAVRECVLRELVAPSVGSREPLAWKYGCVRRRGRSDSGEAVRR